MCSSAPAAPSTQTSTTDLPDWAKPYAKETLAKTQTLTDINTNPYQQYGGERIAGFQPMQEQAFKTMGGLDAGPEAFAKGIGSYMSPYMQNVVDIQKREAGRQSDIAGTQQQAQAAQAGAFGGGRDAIMRAERERNLGQQMNDIQAKGSQAAFDQASNQFRQGITQQSGLAQMQGQMGAQQQQQAQRPLDVAYQDFQNQQNYPYKQLGFMSDMVNRLPLGQKSTSQMYEAPGSTIGQIAGLGVGLGGMANFGSKVMAEGGLAYAGGGDVTSPQNIEAILAKLSDAQLQQAHEAALNRRDVNEAQMIEAVMAQRAAMRQGTEQMPQGIAPALPEQFADGMEQSMATGGIVAFADRGIVTEGEDYSHEGLSSLSPASPQAKPAVKPAKVSKQAKPAVVPESIKPAVAALAEKTGTDAEDLMARVPGLMDIFQKQNAPLLEQQRAMVEQSKPNNEAMRQQGIAQAMMQFGFKMAANASRPNARFLESASAAAPEISAAAQDMNKLMAAKQENYNKLKMDQMKYENALQIGNMKDATILSGQIRQSQQTDKQIGMQQSQLAALIKHQTEMESQGRRGLDIQASQAANAAANRPETLQGLAAAYMKNNPGMDFNTAMDKASQNRYGVSANIRADAALAARRATAVEKANASTAGSMLAMTPKSSPLYAERKAAYDEQVQRELDQLPTDAGVSSAPATGSAAPTISPNAFKIEKIGK